MRGARVHCCLGATVTVDRGPEGPRYRRREDANATSRSASQETSCLGHVPTARRRREVTMISFFMGLALSLAQLSGIVLDPNGHPVANATSSSSVRRRHRSPTRTDAQGRFQFDQLPDGRVDITASAPGLIGEARAVAVVMARPARVDITLRVSAVTETLVVSASQIDQPLSRVADAVTVIDGTRDRRAPVVVCRRGAHVGPRVCGGAKWRARHAHLGLSARRRVGLHAGAGRRDSGQRVWRRHRPFTGAARRRRADRGGARSAERVVWL